MPMISVTKKCPGCFQAVTIEVDKDNYFRWKGGELIQRAFPELTPDQRELLISGTHPECWDKMFADEDWEN
jgi:hypothetical protein